jgi:hypothetical protein
MEDRGLPDCGVGMPGGWAKAVAADSVVPLWPGNDLPPGVKVHAPQNQNPDAHGLIRRRRMFLIRRRRMFLRM